MTLDEAVALVPDGWCWQVSERKTDKFVSAYVHEDQNEIHMAHKIARKPGPPRKGKWFDVRTYDMTPAEALAEAARKAAACLEGKG